MRFLPFNEGIAPPSKKKRDHAATVDERGLTWDPVRRSGKHASVRRRVLEAYGDTCHLCGKPGAKSMDHVIPRSQGGKYSLSNLRPSHAVCNQDRGVMPVEEARALMRK